MRIKVYLKAKAKYILLIFTAIIFIGFFYNSRTSKRDVQPADEYMNINKEHLNIKREYENIDTNVKSIKKEFKKFNIDQMNIDEELENINVEHMNLDEENKNINVDYINRAEEHHNINVKQKNIDEEQKNINVVHMNILEENVNIYGKYMDKERNTLEAPKEIVSKTESPSQEFVHHNISQHVLVQQTYNQLPLSYTTTARQFPAHRRLPENRSHWTSSQEFSRRKRRLDKVCSQKYVGGQVHGVYTHTSGVVYCYVPKAGCTFWKRVFISSNFQPGQDPFSISRNLIHGQYGAGEPYSYAHNEATYPIRLLVVRDPFSRLLSSYLDKMYLPDFWPHISQNVLLTRATCTGGGSDDFLRLHFDGMAAFFDVRRRGTSTCEESGCAKYVTFSEFVTGALVINEPHWAPIHHICNPCAFKASHVAYMESFSQDAMPILHKMGMSHIMDDLNQTDQINKEIEMLIEYHYNRIHYNDVAAFYRECITPRELAYRLWQTFQWKGYIDPQMTYTLPDVTASEETIKEELIRQVWQARKSGLARPEVMERAQKKFIEMAYRSVPKDLFEQLLVKYSTDFELFGYERTRNRMYSSLFNDTYESRFGVQ